MPKTLIVAAGGRVSRRVAAALCDRGEPPRALVRDAAKARDVLVDNRGAPLPVEIVVSDFANRDGVRRALVGIEMAFLALGSSLQQVELEQRFIDVAAEVGLPHLVKLSAAEARGDGVAFGSSLACRNRVTSRGKRHAAHLAQSIDIRRCPHVGRAVDTRDRPMVGERAAGPQRPDRLGRCG